MTSRLATFCLTGIKELARAMAGAAIKPAARREQVDLLRMLADD
jgi:hypothetical protein